MNASRPEWESVSKLWRESPQQIERTALRRVVAAERRRLAAVVIGECLIVAVFAWLSWIAVRDGVAAWDAVWLSTLWLFTAVAAPFAWWNRRGAWRALTESVAEYRRQRVERRRRTLRFATGLFSAEMIVVAAELAWFDRLTALAVALLGLLAVAFAAWAIWMTHRVAQEIATVDDGGM